MKHLLLVCLCVASYTNGFGQINPPTFEWAKSFGGWEDDYMMDMVVDEEGSVYVTGFFYDFICFDTLCLNAVSPDTADIYLAKYDSLGVLVWAKSFGGKGLDEGRALGVDQEGSIYLAGAFSAEIRFDDIQLTAIDTGEFRNVTPDAFITKLDRNGQVIWAKQAKGLGQDRFTHIDISPNGDVWAIGKGLSSEISFDTITKSNPNKRNLYIVRYSESGEVIVARLISLASSTAYFDFNGISTDPEGSVYTAGRVDTPTMIGNVQLNGQFVLKLNEHANPVWANSFPDSLGNWIRIFDLTVAEDSSIYFTGSIRGSFRFDSIEVRGELPESHGYYLAHYGKNGDVLWVKYGLGSWGGRSIFTNRNQVYTTGWYDRTFRPDTLEFTTVNQRGDIFLLRHDSNGELVWGRSIGSPATDWGLGVHGTASGNLYVVGTFPDFNTVLDTIVLSNIFVSTLDLWVGRLSQDSLPPVEIPPIMGEWKVYPNPFEENFTLYGHFDLGETTIELFDLSGKRVYQDQTEPLAGQYRHLINLPHLANGLYLLRLSQNGRYHSMKILKQSR